MMDGVSVQPTPLPYSCRDLDDGQRSGVQAKVEKANGWRNHVSKSLESGTDDREPHVSPQQVEHVNVLSEEVTLGGI